MTENTVPYTANPTQPPTPDFAAQAAALGLPYLHQAPDGTWIVPSLHTAGRTYTVRLAPPACTCPGFARRGRCTHLTLAAAKAAAVAPPAPTVLRETAPALVRLDTLAAGSAFTHFGRTGTLVGPRTGGIRVLFAGGGETCWGALLVAPLPPNVTPFPAPPTCATPACGHPARRRGYCAACIATRAAAAADDLFGCRAVGA